VSGWCQIASSATAKLGKTLQKQDYRSGTPYEQARLPQTHSRAYRLAGPNFYTPLAASLRRNGHPVVVICVCLGPHGRHNAPMTNGPYTEPLIVVNVSNHKISRAALSCSTDRRSL
jgi:hypothetical protein